MGEDMWKSISEPYAALACCRTSATARGDRGLMLHGNEFGVLAQKDMCRKTIGEEEKVMCQPLFLVSVHRRGAYRNTAFSNATTGATSVPCASTAFAASNVARKDAMTIHRDDSIRWEPGQRLAGEEWSSPSEFLPLVG